MLGMSRFTIFLNFKFYIFIFKFYQLGRFFEDPICAIFSGSRLLLGIKSLPESGLPT
jgi:hypothetical protein